MTTLKACVATVPWLRSLVTLAIAVLAAGVGRADIGGVCFSACDIVTQKAVGPFRGAVGEINRPALIPGFSAELSIRPGVCDALSTASAFVNPTTGALLTESEVTLSFVFTPPGATSNVVVLKEDCATLDTSACGSTAVSCIDGAASSEAMQFISRALPGSTELERRLRFQFPDTRDQAGSVCFGGAALGASCSLDADCPGGTCEPVTLTGPLAVAVTQGDAVPCELGATACRDFTGAVICVDDLFELDGTCDTTQDGIEPSAVNVTALPAPFSIADVCAQGSDPACRAPAGTAPIIPFTQDKKGNMMSVLDGREVLIVIDEESFPRLTRASLALRDPTDPTTLNPLTPSSGMALAVNYAPLHPVFQAEPGPDGAVSTLDAAFSIQRATRFFCAEDPNVACAADSECTCTVDSLRDGSGAPLAFPLPASAGGVGPVLGECPLAEDGLPNCRLLGAVTFETLFAADDPDQALAAPVSECIDLPQVVENADGDQIDVVMTLIDRLTFLRQDIGRSGSAGRAVTRVYLSPTVAISSHDVESGVLAFLEPELFECELGAEACDVNANGATSDHNLRVFALASAGSAEDLLPDPLPARPDLNVDGASVAVSSGLVFFRAPADPNPRGLELASADASDNAANGDSLEPSLSPDGSFVAFTTLATNLGFRDRNKKSDVVLKNLVTGEVTPVSVRDRDSCDDRARLGDDASRSPAVSANGLLVAFSSVGERLLGPPKGPPNDRNDVEDVFVFDSASCRVTRVSVGPGGVESNGASFHPSISADGNLVVFESVATNLDPADGTQDLDVYLYDRAAQTTTLISPPGGESPSGRAVAVDGSIALTDGAQVFVSDGPSGALELISLAPDGTTPGDAASLAPSISASGRFVAYQSLATNLQDIGETPGEPADFDVFVFDRVSSTTQRAGVLRAGVRRVPRECRVTSPGAFDPDGDATQAQTTENGRFLVYTTDATNLVPTGAGSSVVVEDLATGALSNLSEAADGDAADGPSSGASVSRTGAVVAFQSRAANLVSGTVAGSNVYVSGLDVSGSGSGSVLGVFDTATGFATVYGGHPAEFVRVQNGTAVFIAPGENVKLFRLACDASGGLCDGTCAGSCSAVVEDLLRPGISAADTIAIDDTHVCAVALNPSGAPVPACHRIGSDPAASLDDIAPAGTEARAIGLVDGNVAFQTPDGELYTAALDAEGQPFPGSLRSHGSSETFVLGDVACFTRRVGMEERMFVVDPADPNNPAADCFASVTSCDLKVCDPRTEFQAVPTRTCKFLTDEGTGDLNENGVPGEIVISRCTLGTDNTDAQTNISAATQGLADPFGPDDTVGELDRRPGCVDPAQPLLPQGECPCDATLLALGFVCSDTLGITFRDNRTDSDGDGILDQNEFCDAESNPDPRQDCGLLTPPFLPTFDCDEDQVDDACDAIVCGDGELQEKEVCDVFSDPNDCAAGCRAQVGFTVSESSINTSQSGSVPSTALSSRFLNLDEVERDGLAPRGLAVETLRFAGLDADGFCPDAECLGGDRQGLGCGEDADCTGGGFCGAVGDTGAPTRHDLTNDARYGAHLGPDRNGDGFPDLALHFLVLGSGLTPDSEFACIKGSFTQGITGDPSSTFVVKSAVNTN